MIKIDHCPIGKMGDIAGMEVSTQEFPLTIDALRPYFHENTKHVLTAMIQKKLVGYALLSFNTGVAIIDSIGVLKDYRMKGVGSKLVKMAHKLARSEGLDVFRILVPSYQVEDKKDPWCIEHWLWKCEFKAIGVSDKPFIRYGKEYDSYIFERQK